MQWIKEGQRISFWGSSDNSVNVIQKFIKRFGKCEIGDIYDFYPTKKFVVLSDKRIEIKKDYSMGGKLALCISKHKSYHEVVSYLENLNAVYGVDYIDIFDCINISGTKEYPYEIITPYATYAPWRKEKEFISIFEKIKNNTLVDMYRLYSLWTACKETAKCTRGDVVEIGVWRGGSGTLLAYGMKQFYKDDTANIFLCDTFDGVVKTGIEDMYYKGGEHSDTSMEIVQELLEKCGIQNAEIVRGIFPDDSYDKFHEKVFRLVHIDVDVYRSAKDIFYYLWEKMIVGGMIIFDDYGFDTTTGITQLCEELEKIKNARCVFSLNGEAIFVKCEEMEVNFHRKDN